MSTNPHKGRALEVNYAGSRRSLSLRLLTLIQDAIVDDSSVHSKDEIMQEFDSTITQLRNAHEWVKFGNKTLGLPGSVGRSVEQDSLLFDSLCEQYDQPQCMGLDELMGRYLEMAHELYKVQRFLKNFNLSLFLNFEDLQTNYLMPMLSTSKKIYVAEAPMIIEETNRKIAYIFAFFLPLIFVLFFLLIKPAMKKVENELHTTHQMLGMVPVHIIKNVPSLLSFVMKGRLMDKDFSHEAQERSRAIIMAAVDAVLELTDAGTIESMNSSGEHITGYAATQVVGKHFSVLLQDDDNTEKLCALLESNVEKMRHRLIGRERSNETSWSSSVLAKKLDGTAFPANATLSLFTVGGKIGCALFLRDTTPEQKHEELLQDEKRMYEELLFSVLPRQIAYRIRNGEQDIVESVPVATVMFADVVQFTYFSPVLWYCVPNHSFQALERFCTTIICNKKMTALPHHFRDNLLKKKYTHIEKIKTIGDCYFCAAGLFDKDARNSHSARAKDVVNFALDMIASLQQTEIRIRVGINTGPVFAGIVGDPSVKPTFDIFGSTVNVASRMESSSSPNTIQMTRATYELVFDSFEFDEQDVDIKGHNHYKFPAPTPFQITRTTKYST
ncbi:adenylate cyclase [Pelomyxa schiedti]|nr:adenylate cyclase [Pelomyxa schiedti]